MRKFILILLSIALTTCAPSHAESNFNYAIKIILKHEGGLVNNKYDTGEISNFGISLRFLKHEKKDINQDGLIDAKDILILTKDLASKIYLDDWWYRYHMDSINDKIIATKMFDISINMGYSQASKILHRAMLATTHPKCPVIIKRNFISHQDNLCINTLKSERFHAEINKQCADYYIMIVKRHPTYKVFLKGWLKRANW